MKQINYLIQKLACIASKAAPLVIVVAGSFVASPMAFALGAHNCSFAWNNSTASFATAGGILVYVLPGGSTSVGATINGISSATNGVELLSYSGGPILVTPAVRSNGTIVGDGGAQVSFPSSSFPLVFYASVSPGATVGQTEQATIQLIYDAFPGGSANLLNTFPGQNDLGCISHVTVIVGPPPAVAGGLVAINGIRCGSSKVNSCPLADVQQGGTRVSVKVTILSVSGTLGVPTGEVYLLDNSGGTVQGTHGMSLTAGSATFPQVSLSNFFIGSPIMEVDVSYTSGNYAPSIYSRVVWVNCSNDQGVCPLN